MAVDIETQSEADIWAVAYGHVLEARRGLLELPPDPLGEHCFANAVLLDAEHAFEELGIRPASVPGQHSPGADVEAALALLSASAEDVAARTVRRILMPLRSEAWEA